MIWFVVLVIFAAAVGAVLVQSNRTSKQRIPLSVTFAGSEPGLPYRAAGFFVTNNADVPIGLPHFKVEVARDSGWLMLSSGPVLMLPDPGLGRTNITHFPKIQAGGYGKIAVEWPEERPCRVEICYTREAKGVEGVISRCKFAWKTRSTARPRTFWVWPPQTLSIDIPK
jgi:hypothetical protein